MNILGIIPARYASSRFPGKPLAKIGGKTMIQRVYEQAKKSSKIDGVIIATDDQRIIDNVLSFGGKVMLTSKSHLNGSSRCLEVFEKIDLQNPGYYQAIVNIQGDEPFIDPSQIDKVCDVLIKQKASIATLVKVIEDAEELFNPNTVKVVFGNDNKALYFSRSPIPYVRGNEKKDWLRNATFHKHIGIYGFSADVLKRIVKMKPGNYEIFESLEQLRWLENGIEIVVDITEIESVGIDTPEDFEKLINKI